MELNRKSLLIERKEAFRLWFEYLKLAQSLKNKEFERAFKKSSKYYAPWNMQKDENFFVWWRTHSQLFEEKFLVKQLQPGELPNNPDSLIIEVPLTQAPSVLIKHIKIILQKASNQSDRTSRKGNKQTTAFYKLSDGAEPKLDAVREMLTVYRDVYLKNKGMRGEKLLDACHSFYLGRKNKRWAKIPLALMPDTDGDKVRAMRNMRRYIQKAEKVLLNVASGEFPGSY